MQSIANAWNAQTHTHTIDIQRLMWEGQKKRLWATDKIDYYLLIVNVWSLSLSLSVWICLYSVDSWDDSLKKTATYRKGGKLFVAHVWLLNTHTHAYTLTSAVWANERVANKINDHDYMLAKCNLIFRKCFVTYVSILQNGHRGKLVSYLLLCACMYVLYISFRMCLIFLTRSFRWTLLLELMFLLPVVTIAAAVAVCYRCCCCCHFSFEQDPFNCICFPLEESTLSQTLRLLK